MATEGFTFFVPANYVNITVTAVVRGAGGITLGTVTKTSGISASVLPYFIVGATGSTFDTVTTSTDVVSIVSATHGSSGLPAPTTSYTWNFQGVNVSNTGSSYAIPLGQTGPLSSTIRLDSGAGFTTSVVDFGTVGSTPAVAIGPYGNTVDSVTGTEHTMNVIASGTPTPTTTYAWNFKGVTLANVTNSFTPTSGNTGPLVGQFSVVNRHGSKVTQVDFGTVGDIPSILATGTPLEADGSTVGDVLTVNVVAYCTPAPTLGYAWFTDGTVVAGENSNTYTTTEAATTAHCMVTASNRHGTTINQVNFGEVRAATVAPTFGAPAPSISPAVGQLNDGETARVLNVNAVGTPTPTITYAWTKTTSLATATVGTNSSSYTAQTADVGATIDCLVTLSNGVSPNATQTFTWGAVLPALTAPFFASGPTADAHDIQVGDVATVVGAIGGNPTPTVSYTWSLDGSVIAGANSSTYTTTTTGTELLAGISASNSEGTVTGTADFGSVSAASSFTKNFAPNFALANTQPSESLYDNGGHTANQAVGYIEMPERIWTPGTTIDFCVSANVVDLEGINKVRVSCHGSTAEVSTVTKGSNGVQGYWFAMNLPAGATTGTPKVYAELIPHNGTSRVVEKEFRSLTPTYVDINVGDTTNDDISALLGHASGSTGTDNMVLRLGAGTYYLTQKSLGTVANKWQEVTTNGNVDVTIIPCVDPAVLGRTGGTPALRLDHTIFRGVTFDTKSAQKVKAGRATYVAFQDCNLTDTWWNQSQGGRPYGIFNGGGLSRNELQQLYFDAYSTTVREPAYEVYDCAMNSPVGGGAILYHNTTMNCSFDPQYIQLGQYANGNTAGQAIFERGMHINKLESIGGAWRFGQRNHFNDYMTVTAVTLENGGLDTKVTFSTADPSDSLRLDRTDVIMGRWDSSEALTTSNRQWVDPSQYQSVRVYGQTGSDDLGYVVAENTDWTDDIFVGDRVICCLWAHPDGFQIGRNTIASGFTGATCDNWLIQDYRVYQDHQPMLFHSSSTSILNCVFDNCSFEQYSPDGFYTLLAQYEGLPKQFAIKNTSMPTTVSLSVRNGAALFSQADMFLIDGCFLQQIGGDAGGETIENCFVTNTVYKQAVNANGMSFGTGNSILAADQYTLSNGRINKFGIPQTSVGTSTTKALPYTIAGTTRSATREIGAYSVGDTANDWVDYSVWESFATARSEITALSAGATIDFTGRKFSADYADQAGGGVNVVATNKSVQILGGQFSAGRTASWSSIGNGVYAADHNFGDYRSPLLYIQDDAVTGDILMRVDPLPPADADKYRFVNNKNWVVITASDGTNNGVVGTVGGSGASSPITGMQITDSTTKTTINNLIGGVTIDTSGADVKGPWAILHSANNVTAPVMITSWDNSTGMMGVTGFAGSTTIAYSGTYLKMTFCGLPGQTLSAGEYCLDFTEGITGGRVLYKPVSGDASDARIPVCDYVFSIGGAGSTFSIDGVTIEGTSARGSAPGAIIDNTDCNYLTVKNCNIRDHATGVRLNYVPATFDKNVMRRFTSRAMAVVAGTQLTNNILEHAEALSACLIQTEDNTDGVPYTLVQDNIFALESSTHGQGLSLYKNAWRNALVKHNIFYNCQRAHSFQNGGLGSDGNPREECYGYTFENNLVVVDKVLDIPGFLGGQKSISFNGGSDSIIESNGNQTAAIRSNTVVMTSNVPDTLGFASKLQLTSLDIHDLRHTSTVVENNIYSTANASLGSDVNGGHTHSNNVSTRINYVNATSTTDKLTHVNPDDVFEPNSFQAKVVAGGAHDNTKTGIRWTAVPTVAQIETIISNGDTNWASTYAGSTLPAQGSYSTAVHETQEMGATFGGTGSFEIPWYSTAASYRTSTMPPPDGTTSGALGATGMAQTFSMWCYAPPSYASEFILFNFPSDEHKDKFYNAVSGDHAFSLSVTVVNGGSGAEFGQHAATAGHVFNYYWPVGQMTSFSSNATRLGLADASASSDPWPNAGITAHLWGQNPTINMQGATVSLDPSEQYTTITQNVTGYDGVQTSFEWTVNLEAVGSTGTFVDGSLWIVPAAGKTLRLYKTTPTNVTAHHGISSFGQQVGLTVYRNGVSINEKVGYEHGSLSDLISGSNTTVTGGFRTTDNRHSGIYGSPATIQDQLDELFDVTTFTSRQTILDAGTGGSGITLSTDDSVVLTRSYWDDTDDTDVGSWSNGIPLTGENTRTPIAQTAVLSVLSSAPVGDYFRPPIQWADGDRSNRPMYAASAFDHSNFGITAGYGAHSASENPTPLGVSMDKLMNSPFLHTYGGIVYAASWPRESFAREDQGYGGAVMLGFGEALSEVYNTTITDEPDSAKLNLLYRFIQYGIDQFGVVNRRPKISSGAGQKPAVSAPWMMLAASALGVTHGINSVVRTFVPGASALTDGSTSMAALKQQLFHEDYTLRQITTGTPDNWSSIGYTGAGNHLGTSGGHGYTLDLSNINGGVLADFDSDNVLEPKDGGAGNGIPYTFPLTTGVGRLDFTSTPMQSISSVAHNGATASVISAYPKGLYAGDYVGTKVGIKQTSGSTEEFYTLIMLSQDAGAYDVYDAATSSGACSFWLDRPLTAQPDSSSEIRIYPFGTEDNGGWTFLKEGAVRPDGEGGGAGATMGISRDASLSLTSTGYEKVSARAWIPVYMFLRNNYSKMGLGTSKIGEAINGYMGTILEKTTSNDRRWQLMYGGDNIWSGYITAVTEAEAWISHSSITSDNKYYLPGTAPATAASGVPFYECSFTNANTSGQTDRIVSANHIESTGCTDLYNLERYNSRTMNSMGLGTSVVDHWVSHTTGGPFSLADYSTKSEFISAFNDMSGSGGTVDALLTADGITYPGVASASSVSGSVVSIRTTFLSGTSADEFKTRALGLSGSGATIGIRYSKNSITNTLSYSITHPAYGE